MLTQPHPSLLRGHNDAHLIALYLIELLIYPNNEITLNKMKMAKFVSFVRLNVKVYQTNIGPKLKNKHTEKQCSFNVIWGSFLTFLHCIK